MVHLEDNLINLPNQLDFNQGGEEAPMEALALGFGVAKVDLAARFYCAFVSFTYY